VSSFNNFIPPRSPPRLACIRHFDPAVVFFLHGSLNACGVVLLCFHSFASFHLVVCVDTVGAHVQIRFHV